LFALLTSGVGIAQERAGVPPSPTAAFPPVGQAGESSEVDAAEVPIASQTTDAAQATDAAEPQRSAPGFSLLADRYGQVVMLVRRLQQEREERAFELAAERYIRAAEFMRRLQEKRDAEETRAFNERLGRFLKVRELMKKLRPGGPVRELPQSDAGATDRSAT
jgi:hypothetical protein